MMHTAEIQCNRNIVKSNAIAINQAMKKINNHSSYNKTLSYCLFFLSLSLQSCVFN